MDRHKLNGFINEIEKNAGFGGNVVKLIGKIAPALAIGAGIGAGIEGVRQTHELVKNRKMQNEVDASYKIIISDPALQQMMIEDPKITEQTIEGAFNVLAKFAPALAATPEVARGFVRYSVHNQGGDVDTKTVSDLIAAHANYSKGPQKDFAERVFGGGSGVLKSSLLPSGSKEDWYKD